MTTRPIIRTIALWTAIILGCALFVLAAPPHPADAATVTFTFEGSDHMIPRPEALAPIDQLRPVATYDVIANGHEAFIGSVCTFVVTAANGSSVHLLNQGFLTTNGSSTDILRTEDEPDVLRTVLDEPTLVLGETVELYNIIGEWAEGNTTRQGYVGTSVDYKVTATCTSQPDDPDDTTTTTQPVTTSSTTPTETTTTTSPSTTTTFPSTSTTIPATSTTVPTDSSTTTVPPSTSTTEGSSTSTTAPVSSTTSSSLIEQDTSTTIPPTTDETLPFTGPPVEAAGIAMAAVALLVLGGAVLMAGRES